MQLIRLQVNVFLRLQIIWREALWIKAESARGAVKAKVRLILKPQLSTTIKKRSFPSRGLFSFFSFLFHIPPHTCLLQEAVMSASQPSGNWQGGECVCVCTRRVYLSVILVFYFLCAQTRTITLNCASLCFAPFLSHSLCLSFSITLPFFPHSPQRNEFLLFTRLCLITLERKGEKEGEMREGLHTKRKWKKNTLHSCTALHKRNKETGAGGVRCCRKKDSFLQERQGGGVSE